MLSPFFIPEAVASSKVEQIETTNKKVLESFGKPDSEVGDAEKEAKNYQKALMKGMLMVSKNTKLSTNDIINIQKLLLPKKDGLRDLPGYQIANKITGEVYYTPPETVTRLRSFLSNLEKYLNEDAPEHELIPRMAIIHYQFEAIHPFKDGNGRTGRMLMPLYLYQQKALDIPILFISRYILDNREKYNLLLRNVTYKNEWKEWILFMIEAVISQAAYTADVMTKILKKVDDTRELLAQDLKHIDGGRVIEFIFSEPLFSVKMFETHTDLSYATARKYLTLLIKKGVLKKNPGKHKDFYYSPVLWSILKAT